MKITPQQLPSHCRSKQLLALYWIAGEDPYQTTQTQQQLVKALHQNGFEDKIKITVDNTGFKADELFQHCSNLSLFSTKQRIEITVLDKIPDGLQKALLSFIETPNDDTVIIVQSNRLTPAQQKTKWFTTLDKKMGFIPIWPIETNQLPGYLQNEAKQRGLQLDQDACQYLAASTEGNLLAAAQTLDKLAYTIPELPPSNSTGGSLTLISLETLKQHVEDQARFDIYTFTDAFLLNQKSKALRVLNHLKAEQVEPTIITWSLVREIRLLTELHKAKQHTPLAQAFKQKGIWPKRQQVIQPALRHYSYPQCLKLLQQLAELDKITKGLKIGDSWQTVIQLIL